MTADSAVPATSRSVSRATFWAAVETAGAQGSAFLFFVVFARLLSPHEFGVYALAMAIVGAVNMILFQGFGDGLIQAQRVDDEATSTAFWTNMGMAGLMIAGLQVVASLAEPLFGEPTLGPVIAWLSLLCLPRALVSVHLGALSALARLADLCHPHGHRQPRGRTSSVSCWRLPGGACGRWSFPNSSNRP